MIWTNFELFNLICKHALQSKSFIHKQNKIKLIWNIAIYLVTPQNCLKLFLSKRTCLTKIIIFRGPHTYSWIISDVNKQTLKKYHFNLQRSSTTRGWVPCSTWTLDTAPGSWTPPRARTRRCPGTTASHTAAPRRRTDRLLPSPGTGLCSRSCPLCSSRILYHRMRDPAWN